MDAIFGERKSFQINLCGCERPFHEHQENAFSDDAKKQIRAAFRCPCSGEQWTDDQIEELKKKPYFRMASDYQKKLSEIVKGPVSGCPWFVRGTDRLLHKVYEARSLSIIDPSLSIDRETTPVPVVEAMKHYLLSLQAAENWVYEWKKEKREKEAALKEKTRKR